MNENNKNVSSGETKSIAGNMAWSVMERFTSQILSTIVSVILARLLFPEDYASVALVTVFVNLAGVVVSSSFSAALIYDKEQSVERYSTAFYSVLILTGGMYLILYILAPLISAYYNDKAVVKIMRVMSFLFVLQGVYSILFAYVSKNMLFKKTYKATFFGAITGAVVAITLAINGHGIWALVFQPIIETTISSIILWRSIRFRLVLKFDVQYAKFMTKYCVKFVLVDLLNSFYSSINSLIIAKKYSKADLAYYTKAYNLPQMLVGSVNTAISKVLFPVFSESQDNIEMIKLKLRKGIQLSCYALMPLMVGLMMIADGAVVMLFTDKWVGMVPYLQIMCMVWVFQPVQICAIQAYKAIGKGSDYFRLEIYKKVLSIVLLIAMLIIAKNPIIVAWAVLVSQIISCAINMPYLKKMFNYSFWEQILDMLVPMLLCAVMGICVFFVGKLIGNLYLRIAVQILTGMVTYVLASFVSKNSSFTFALDLIKQYKSGKTENSEN